MISNPPIFKRICFSRFVGQPKSNRFISTPASRWQNSKTNSPPGLIPFFIRLSVLSVLLAFFAAFRSVCRWFFRENPTDFWLEVNWLFEVLEPPYGFKLKNIATTEFLLVENVCVVFSNFSTDHLSQSEIKVVFPIAEYASITRCWCHNLTIRSSICRCSRLKILRMCWDMLLRERIKMIFWKVGGARYKLPSELYDFSNWDFFGGLHTSISQYRVVWLFWNVINVRVQFQCTNFEKLCTLIYFHDHID